MEKRVLLENHPRILGLFLFLLATAKYFLRTKMEFMRLWKALTEIQNDANKHSFIELSLAYDTLQQKHPSTFEYISKIINSTLRGKFTLEKKRNLSKAIYIGDLYLFFNRVNESFLYGFLVLAIIGLIGNCLVIVYFLRLHKNNFQKISSYHFLIIALAITDIICCISATSSYYLDWKIEWLGNELLCNISQPLFVYTLPNISFWVIALLAYERYRNIVHPFARKLGIKVYSILLLLISLLSSPVYYLGNLVESSRTFHIYNNIKYCQLNIGDMSHLSYHIGSAGVAAMVLLPLLINIVCVLKIFNYIKQNSMKASVDIQNKNIDSKSSSQNHNSINKRNVNAFKTLTFLVLIYVFSIVPGRLFMYVWGHYFTFVKNDLVFDTKHYALLWTSMVARISFLDNNVVNFIVYAYMIKGFRKFLFSVLAFGILKKLKKRK